MIRFIFFVLVLLILYPNVRKILRRIEAENVVKKRGFTNPTTGRADSDDYIVRKKPLINKPPGFFARLIDSFRAPELPGYMKSASVDDEYSRLLKYFDLTDKATDEEIRKSYRDKVKLTHPDVISGVSEDTAATASFRETKQNYNRLMNVRSAMFGR